VTIDASTLRVGDRIVRERTFTADDIHAFTAVSRDRGRQHVAPDERGRLMAQGLLVASLATELGGELNYLAREMVLEFLRPVFAGDTIRCEITVVEASAEPDRIRLRFAVVMRNQADKEVMTGTTHGVVRQPGGAAGATHV
jgi:acyl dehydratase